MASGREIRYKINSIRSTQKITRAMQMVAASKMRKAQDRMLAARPYSVKILEVVSHLAKAHPEFHHPFLASREIKRVGYIVVSSIVAWRPLMFHCFVKCTGCGRGKDKIDQDFCLIGTKADAFLAA